MNRNLVLQRDNSQNSAFKLLYSAPEPIPVPLLRFDSKRFFQDPNAPILFQIRTLAQNFMLEIFRKSILWHVRKDTPFAV